MQRHPMQRFAKLIDRKTGKTVAEMFHAPNALRKDADIISRGLYILSETIIRGLKPKERGGGLGGEFGYGVNFENKVFGMHRYCWREKESCRWCSGNAPNFWHKESGLEICWYKWIGRSMEMNRKSLSGKDWFQIWESCMDSIPAKARAKAKKEHDFENTPKYLEEARKQQEEFFKVIRREA